MSGNPEAHDYASYGEVTAPGWTLPDAEAAFERLRLAREGAEVDRCHSHPHARRYSVGHHSSGVAQIIILGWPVCHEGQLPSAELITAALFHDTEERILGDIPQPVATLFKEQLLAANQRILDWLGTNPQLSPEEREWLHAADRLELFLWCIEQARDGDLKFIEWCESYLVTWATKPLPTVLMEMARCAWNSRMPRMRGDQLMEIAGL